MQAIACRHNDCRGTCQTGKKLAAVASVQGELELNTARLELPLHLSLLGLASLGRGCDFGQTWRGHDTTENGRILCRKLTQIPYLQPSRS